MGGSRQWGIAFKWAEHTERSVKITVYGFQRSFYERRMKKSEWESGEKGYWSKKKGIYKQWFQGHCADWLRERRYTQESSSCALVAAASGLSDFFFVCFTFFEWWVRLISLLLRRVIPSATEQPVNLELHLVSHWAAPHVSSLAEVAS